MQAVYTWMQNNRAVVVGIVVAVCYVVLNYQKILTTVAAWANRRTASVDDDHAAFVPLDAGYSPLTQLAVDRATMFTWLDTIRSEAIAAGNTQAVATTNKLINDLFTFDPKPTDGMSVNPPPVAPIPGPVPPRMV